MEKMWALLVNMGAYHDKAFEEFTFDEELWDYVIEEGAKSGLNTIVIDIGGGIDFASHPELTSKGAWSRERLKSELERCRNKGISLIPKLNFATPHDGWLKDYQHMISTPLYYQVCKDMIEEAYELFEHPEYIHIGMDEEDAKHVKRHELAIYRQGELYWHDIRFFIDCVKQTGAIPWMWACPLFDHPEEYKKHIAHDEAIISPWYYNAFKKENWTPINSRQEYLVYYNEGQYKDMNIEYVEEDPFLVNFRNVALPLMADGYHYVPCASTVNKCECNTSELVEYFKTNAPDEQIKGFITAPWGQFIMKNKYKFEDSLRLLKEAKAKFY